MYAVVRDNTFDPEELAQGRSDFSEFQHAHAARPGYRVSIVVDAGAGRQISITLWGSQEEAEAARAALGPVIQRTLVPHMAAPSVLVGVGDVIFDDLTTAGAGQGQSGLQ